MQSVWGVYVPSGEDEFPGSIVLRKQLRRCSCGQMTFLSLPCRCCGAQKSEPAFRWALRRARIRRAGRWGLAAAYVLVAGYAALWIWPPLAVLIAVGTVAALAVDAIQNTAEDDICFWLFHDGTGRGKNLPVADISRIGALTDAYDADLRRLKQMLESDHSPKCAERVFYLTQELAQVFHNRQVSALLMNCLTALPLSEGISIDLDQICAWLLPEDVSPDAMAKLEECARFTCLSAGVPTARFVGRFCAFRLQKSLESSGVKGSYAAGNISRRELSLRKAIPSRKEQACLSALWNLSGIYLTPQTSQEAAPAEYFYSVSSDTDPEHGGDIAASWLQSAFENPNSPEFREMERLLCDRLGSSLKKKWRKGRDEL